MKIILLPNLKFCPYGKIIKFKLMKYDNLCNILLKNNINIPHFCEKIGKCSTCLIKINEGYSHLKKIDYEEVETIVKYTNILSFFRLSCQVILTDNVNLLISIPS